MRIGFMMRMIPILMIAVLFAGDVDAGDDPVAFGRREIERTVEELRRTAYPEGTSERRLLDRRAERISIRVTGQGEPESFRIRRHEGKLLIEGADATGAMYGALEMAGKMRLNGVAQGWGGSGTPWLRERGLNLFLTLPWDYGGNNTNYDPQTLVDPDRWWFQNDDYWQTLFDIMARSRLNWLDIHGTWDVSVTNAPNLYAYFIQSGKFPEVGVVPEIKAACLAQLNRVIDMAHARGVRVSLMAYEARFRIPQNPEPPYEENEANIYAYTREVVEKMIRQAPGLDAIGFRIGESGRGGEFYRCYIEAVERSGRDIPLITRSWVTRKAKVVPLARQSSDFTVEIKYNGEQWGAPYMLAGGRVPGWYSYSFEDYLSDSGDAPSRKMWPGNPAPASGRSGRWRDNPPKPEVLAGRWPDQPYKIVWQVRASGTHRIFPFYNPDKVRSSIRCMKIGTASGFTIEPLNAYYPASPRYYTADPEDIWCDWVVERDSLYYMLWGRLGYDPATRTKYLDDLAALELEIEDKNEKRAVLSAWKGASGVVPGAFSAYSLGPDHRNHAPEMEWGGGTEAFIVNEPFDSHRFMSMKEAMAIEATDGIDGRYRPADAAAFLNPSYTSTRASRRFINSINAMESRRLNELKNSVLMLWHLADYYRNRFIAAHYMAHGNLAGVALTMERAHDAWAALSESPEAQYYKPFTERLRMRTNHFHWKNELSHVRAEANRFESKKVKDPDQVIRIDPLTASLRSRGWGAPRTAVLEWHEEGEDVVCTIPAEEALPSAWLLAKPLPSSTFFHKIPMTRMGEPPNERYEARIERPNCGLAVAAELDVDFDRIPTFPQAKPGREIRRVPSSGREAPYLVVPARQGPTPAYWSSQEAMTYLQPDSLDPARHGLLLLATRAWDFHRRFYVATQRKLLDAVERGLDLLVLQQDYTSGRFPLHWFPRTPRIVNRGLRRFDPGGALGLEPIEADNIIWQPIEPGDGWEVFGNGGVARCRHGKGSIWLVQARLMQNMHLPACAKALVHLLGLKGKEKPVVVVDPGTEGAHFATSVFVDLMNAHEIPFLTLGEVIAREQGMDCFDPVSGRIWDDNVLEGRGPAMMKSFLERKVKKAAARPIPATREEAKRARASQKKELMRCLGLDPLPPRTPLDARVTGVIERSGYRIEKIVFESRPKFPVTALLYLPADRDGSLLPVIVNPHGHWKWKKGERVVQKRAIAQALRGYAALVVDSPGHSFEGDAVVERRGAGTHHDLRLVLGSTNATAAYVWDLMRALDYLETRPEVDMSRVGITGTSGGGLATLYAFAAEERFTCAVPVCYATSLEVNPHNGCPCNHVPGTLRIGDRSDVLAIRAPSPVLIIGARHDSEFPPAGTELTGRKLEAFWKLFDAAGKVKWRIFESGHDYNGPMREAAMGFFDLHLRGKGDGSPVPEGEIETEPPGSSSLTCLADPPAGQLTLRKIAQDRLARAEPRSFDDVVALNGGLPQPAGCSFRIMEKGDPRGRTVHVLLESEQGLTLPGLLRLPDGVAAAGVVLLSDGGKSNAFEEFAAERLAAEGLACLAVDVRGTGELAGLDPRLMAYLGTSGAFAMGWDAARAAAALRRYTSRVAVGGLGRCGAQAALFAALMDREIEFVAGLRGLREYSDCFAEDVPLAAIQPRADLCAPLSHLRSLVIQPAVWTFTGGEDPDPAALLIEWSEKK